MSDQMQVLNRNIDALSETSKNYRLDSNVLTLKALAQTALTSIEHSWAALNDMQVLFIVNFFFSFFVAS